jgi:hypothetical protein
MTDDEAASHKKPKLERRRRKGEDNYGKMDIWVEDRIRVMKGVTHIT